MTHWKPPERAPRQSSRNPGDGLPYYCAHCGLGWSEYMACEEPDCRLETAVEALDRQRARMINQAEEPLTKVTMNLFEADVEWLQIHIGNGWTKAVRDLVRSAIKEWEHDERYSRSSS